MSGINLMKCCCEGAPAWDPRYEHFCQYSLRCYYYQYYYYTYSNYRFCSTPVSQPYADSYVFTMGARTDEGPCSCVDSGAPAGHCCAAGAEAGFTVPWDIDARGQYARVRVDYDGDVLAESKASAGDVDWLDFKIEGVSSKRIVTPTAVYHSGSPQTLQNISGAWDSGPIKLSRTDNYDVKFIWTRGDRALEIISYPGGTVTQDMAYTGTVQWTLRVWIEVA